MKQLTGYIQPHRLSRVVKALHDAPSFPGFTVLHAHGQGHGRGAGGRYAFGGQDLLYQDRCVVLVICADDQAGVLAEAIAGAAHTGNEGDGIVTISPIESLVRIRDAVATESQS